MLKAKISDPDQTAADEAFKWAVLLGSAVFAILTSIL